MLDLYEVKDATVVIIDVLRATSTIATAIFNGANCVVPVDSIEDCIKLGEQHNMITAGERDGHIAEGLKYGNTPFQYTPEFIGGKDLALTTTNGTRLLHMALAKGAGEIITGSFPNISAICNYLTDQKNNTILACAAWKNKVNIEDTLFAGAVVSRVKEVFQINCDSSHIAENLFEEAKGDLFDFMRINNASHYNRLMGYDLEADIRFCLSEDVSNVLPIYKEGRLIAW